MVLEHFASSQQTDRDYTEKPYTELFSHALVDDISYFGPSPGCIGLLASVPCPSLHICRA